MGAGTITMPYIISLTGIGLGAILIVIGALVSFYTSSLLVGEIDTHKKCDLLTEVLFH